MAEKDREKLTAETLSFPELMDRGLVVTIPKIQRDYAQGRLNKRTAEIREQFVQDLYDKISKRTPINLEFVYGSLSGSRFIPLDGQQRLTTLFLLHVYLDGMCGGETERKFSFTYETRDSSTRFCNELISQRREIFNLETMTLKKENEKDVILKPSQVIREQRWWFLSWNDDPTVAGMLTMLDEIHKVFFAGAADAYDYLFNSGNAGVTFQFLPLKKFYDPDDLYMKMNARGLPLTRFEIFKSRWIEDVVREFSAEESKQVKSKIDVDWTDYLWPLRKRGEMKNIDIYLQRLFKIMIASARVRETEKNSDEQLDYLFEANKKEISFAHSQYVRKYGVVFNRRVLERIIEQMDQLCDSGSLINRYMQDTEWIDLSDIWNRCIINGEPIEYKDRLALHGAVRFSALFKNATKEEFVEWKRLLHNLIASQRINNSSEMARAIRNVEILLDGLVKTTASGNVDVNDYVSKSMNLKNDFFRDYIWSEEVIKAQLRKDSGWRAAIERAEKHSYLDGQIGVVLYLAGVIDEKIPFTKDVRNADLATFTAVSDKLLPLFDELGNGESRSVKDFLMVRAMLVKGDYMPWSSSWRKNFYNRPGHRDYSWKALFIISDGQNKAALNCLREVVEDSEFDEKAVDVSLEQIGKQKMEGTPKLWRLLLTSRYYRNLMRRSHQGFIAFDNNKVLIYGSSQRNGHHAELVSAYLYEALRDTLNGRGYSSEYYTNKGSKADYDIMINGKKIVFKNGVLYAGTTELKNIKTAIEYIEQ